MAAIEIVDNYLAVQYTGSNSAEIQSLVTNTTIVSEVGGVLVIESPTGSTPYTVNTGEWVRYTQHMIISVHPTAPFNLNFNRYATYAALATLQSQVTANTASITTLNSATAAGVRSVGVQDCPTLLLNSTTVVPVILSPALPNTSFTATAQLFGPLTVLANLTVTAVNIVNTTTVNVTVQNTGLAAVGAHLLVVVKP